jgi:hypothetical protein
MNRFNALEPVQTSLTTIEHHHDCMQHHMHACMHN